MQIMYVHVYVYTFFSELKNVIEKEIGDQQDKWKG